MARLVEVVEDLVELDLAVATMKLREFVVQVLVHARQFQFYFKHLFHTVEAYNII
jgi:hypothetical protein